MTRTLFGKLSADPFKDLMTHVVTDFELLLELSGRLAKFRPASSKRIARLAGAELWKDKTGKLAAVHLDR